MKLSLRLILFLATLTITSLNALAIELQSDFYNAGDTFIAFSSEELLSSSARIFDSSGSDVKVGFLGYRAGNTSFLYFDIPLWMKGNYTLNYIGENIPFIVSDGSSIILRPVALFIDEKTTSARIDLKNQLADSVSADVAVSNSIIQISRSSITIPRFSTRSIFLTLDPKKVDGSSVVISYGSGKRKYTVNVFLAAELSENESIELISNETKQEAEQPESNNLRIIENITYLKHTIPRTKMINGSLHFVANKDLKNVQFHLTTGIAEIVTLNTTGYNVMKQGQYYEQYLWINRYRNFPDGEYVGVLSLDDEEGNTVNVTLDITLTATAAKEEPKQETKKPITRPVFNVTEVSNFTIINYTEQLRLEQEKRSKNLRLGLLLLAIFLAIASLIVYFFRPKQKELKFKEYVEQFKKGARKK